MIIYNVKAVTIDHVISKRGVYWSQASPHLPGGNQRFLAKQTSKSPKTEVKHLYIKIKPLNPIWPSKPHYSMWNVLKSPVVSG